MRSLLLALVVACAPSVDGPVERQATLDRADAERLTAQLVALPGVVRAEVLLRRPVADPLAVTAPAAPSTSMVIVVDDRADRERVTAAARALAGSVTPAAPTVIVEVGATRAELARVGPFTVEAGSKGPLKGTLTAALALIAALAAWIAWTYRRGNSAQ